VNAEVPPTRGQVGIGYLAYRFKRHRSIIRFRVSGPGGLLSFHGRVLVI
jgi:hypothetical protein